MIISVKITGYTFSQDRNPFQWDATPRPQSVVPIASQLDATIVRYFAGKKILVRALQSSKRTISRDELLVCAARDGYDKPHTDGTYDFHAAEFLPFTKTSSTKEMFEGFHKWKPKCEERPQLPLDFIMVFDAECYEAIEYIHPRHGTKANDRYRLRDGAERVLSLIAIILIN